MRIAEGIWPRPTRIKPKMFGHRTATHRPSVAQTAPQDRALDDGAFLDFWMKLNSAFECLGQPDATRGEAGYAFANGMHVDEAMGWLRGRVTS
jgi:hypothetical protein